MTGVNIEERDKSPEMIAADPETQKLMEIDKYRSIAVVDTLKTLSAHDVSLCAQPDLSIVVCVYQHREAHFDSLDLHIEDACPI